MPRKSGAKRATNQVKPTLGDTDAESDDNTAFQSPEPDDDTDYGLEFTTSRLTLQDANNRRSSTLRQNSGLQRARQADTTSNSDEDYENHPPSPTRRMASQPEKRHAPSKQFTTQSTRSQASFVGQNQTRRRKNPNPVSRAKRMDEQIHRLQNYPGMLIPKLPFSRLVRELILKYSNEPHIRVTEGAFLAMQTSSELFLTQRLADSYMLTKHRGRVTLEVRDMALMAFICDRGHP
uniref:Cid2 n=1 Tax=Drosophila eugracilis TaxID=29029 RepID=A0A1V0HRH1_DROEU|nr:Cid2 [Drosophila eugracilis]ARC76674.1 Cid2 [Drosophila eugracilis]